jgi:para-nitrobenzyl esterase
MSTVARDVIVSTGQGRLRGAWSEGVAAFKGIPYAAAPFGPNRFLGPKPPDAWDGVRDALDYGPIAPQTPYPPPIFALLGDQGVPGEDCLNLNVWTPDPSPRARLPVMVWIPGGAFARGAGSLPIYEGSAFARDGVVCVTINYRLGADGFLYLDEAISNRGLLDQVAALQWVQQNIEAFGGDPGNVTVFGESAGAFSIGTLIAMPAARGLFRRAILQSGAAHHSVSIETARMVRANLADALGAEPSLAGMAEVPLARFVVEQSKVAADLLLRPDPSRWGEVVANGMMFEPIVDGDLLPGRAIERIAGGASRGLDILVGTTAEEWRFFMVPVGVVDQVTDQLLAVMVAARGLKPETALPVYRSSRPDASPGDLLAAVVTDWFFRLPAIRLAEAHVDNGGSPFLYEFAWRSPLFDGMLGACHALEIPFVFDRVDAGESLTGEHAPQALADAMHAAWVAFARTGDPGWPPYSPARRAVTRYTEAGGTVVIDPGSAERQLWEGVR